MAALSAGAQKAAAGDDGGGTAGPSTITFRCLVAGPGVGFRASKVVTDKWTLVRGPKQGELVQAVDADAQWLTVRVPGHGLKYLPAVHPRDGTGLFGAVADDGGARGNDTASTAASAAHTSLLVHAQEATGWDFPQMLKVMALPDAQRLVSPYVGADVPDDVPTPPRWLAAEPGKPNLARLRWRYTTTFRETFGLDQILQTPHPLFAIMARHIPMRYLGRDLSGRFGISLEAPPRCNVEALAKLGIGIEEIAYHYIWYSEYGYRRLGIEANINVIDFAGASLSHLRGARKRLSDLLGQYFEQHNPESTKQINFLNSPSWFGWVVFPLIKLIAAKETVAKMFVFGKKDAKKARAHLATTVDLALVPSSVGGTCEITGDWAAAQQETHDAMVQFAHDVCAASNVEMLTEDALLRQRHGVGH